MTCPSCDITGSFRFFPQPAFFERSRAVFFGLKGVRFSFFYVVPFESCAGNLLFSRPGSCFVTPSLPSLVRVRFFPEIVLLLCHTGLLVHVRWESPFSIRFLMFQAGKWTQSTASQFPQRDRISPGEPLQTSLSVIRPFLGRKDLSSPLRRKRLWLSGRCDGKQAFLAGP